MCYIALYSVWAWLLVAQGPVVYCVRECMCMSMYVYMFVCMYIRMYERKHAYTHVIHDTIISNTYNADKLCDESPPCECSGLCLYLCEERYICTQNAECSAYILTPTYLVNAMLMRKFFHLLCHVRDYVPRRIKAYEFQFAGRMCFSVRLP